MVKRKLCQDGDGRTKSERYRTAIMRTNLGWPPAPHWPTLSCVALSVLASTAASDQLYFVWDTSRGKSAASDHHLK